MVSDLACCGCFSRVARERDFGWSTAFMLRRMSAVHSHLESVATTLNNLRTTSENEPSRGSFRRGTPAAGRENPSVHQVSNNGSFPFLTMHYKRAPRFRRRMRLWRWRCSVWLHQSKRIWGSRSHSFERNSFRAVLAVKGSLRRAQKRRALDRSGPL